MVRGNGEKGIEREEESILKRAGKKNQSKIPSHRERIKKEKKKEKQNNNLLGKYCLKVNQAVWKTNISIKEIGGSKIISKQR